MKNLIKPAFKNYGQLSKIGIVSFALFTAGLAYILSLSDFSHFSFGIFALFMLGFYFTVSGGFILNQAQEWPLDQKMDRAKNRPIPSGKVSPLQAYILAVIFLFFGLSLLFLLKPLTAFLAFITVVLYNGFYTVLWKRYFRYGAVLGALPGALPPVIGYSLGTDDIFSGPCLYLFLLMFFWQMPHFWSLAIHYRKDYKKAGFPVLPVLSGRKKTLRLIGFYMLSYIGLALISPLFLSAGLIYMAVLPSLALILIYQFHKYFYKPSHWIKFFLWINASIIVCFAVPVLDKWILFFFVSRI